MLGPLTVLVDGEPVVLRAGRSRIVLALLALEDGRTVQRASLIRSLWEDDPPPSAVNVVQVAVSMLRRELGPDAIRSTPAGYALAPASVDVVELDDAVRRASRAAEAGDDVAVGTVLAPFLERFRPPLEDLGDSRFVTETRHRVTDGFLTGVELYAAAAVRSGRADTAVGLLPELVNAHPLREGLLEQLVLALGAVGRETEAIAAYVAGRDRIAEHLGVDPGTRLRSAYERVLRQDLPLQGAASVHRLRTAGPDSGPALIGRDEVLLALSGLLDRPETRLVTLVGPPGIGKSHLAETIARRRDGAMLSVSDARTPEELATAIVTRAVDPPPAGRPTAALVRVLRQRPATLLVLDDLTVDAPTAAWIDDLLAAVPALQLVVTARRPLRVPAEVRFPVLPLDVESRNGAPSPAATLLADCLSRDRGGRIPLDERPILEEIARLCDGIPLALRLAASSSRVRSLAAVRDGLARSSAEPGDPRADGGALAGAMRSSLAELPQDALALLRAATCFLDGGDVTALASVAGLGPDAGDVAAAELLDRGLLIRSDGDRRVRLRLLAPVREAVLARTDAGALDAVRAAAIAYYDTRYCSHEWFERAPRTADGLTDLTEELRSLRSVLTAAAQARSPRLPRMVARLAWASTLLAIGAPWRRWRDAALALPGVTDQDRFDLLVAAPDGPAAIEEAERIVQRMRDPAREGWLRFRQARTALDRGDRVAAARAIDALAAAAEGEHGGAGPFLHARLLDARQMLALRLEQPRTSLELTDLAMRAAVDEGRVVEAELLEVVRTEVLIVAGRPEEAADAALDLLERTTGASPWVRGATLSLRGVALLDGGAVGAALDAQRAAVGLLLGSPWRIERLEVLLRWAAARLAGDPVDHDAAYVVGVWAAVMERLDLEPWPVEQVLVGSIDLENDAGLRGARRAGEQAVRLDGPDPAVEEAMRAILDGRRPGAAR